MDVLVEDLGHQHDVGDDVEEGGDVEGGLGRVVGGVLQGRQPALRVIAEDGIARLEHVSDVRLAAVLHLRVVLAHDVHLRARQAPRTQRVDARHADEAGVVVTVTVRARLHGVHRHVQDDEATEIAALPRGDQDRHVVFEDLVGRQRHVMMMHADGGRRLAATRLASQQRDLHGGGDAAHDADSLARYVWLTEEDEVVLEQGHDLDDDDVLGARDVGMCIARNQFLGRRANDARQRSQQHRLHSLERLLAVEAQIHAVAYHLHIVHQTAQFVPNQNLLDVLRVLLAPRLAHLQLRRPRMVRILDDAIPALAVLNDIGAKDALSNGQALFEDQSLGIDEEFQSLAVRLGPDPGGVEDLDVLVLLQGVDFLHAGREQALRLHGMRGPDVVVVHPHGPSVALRTLDNLLVYFRREGQKFRLLLHTRHAHGDGVGDDRRAAETAQYAPHRG